MSIYTQPRESAALRNFLTLMPFGAEDLGFNDETSALVNVSADGVDLNTIWTEVAGGAYSAERRARRYHFAAVICHCEHRRRHTAEHK